MLTRSVASSFRFPTPLSLTRAPQKLPSTLKIPFRSDDYRQKKYSTTFHPGGNTVKNTGKIGLLLLGATLLTSWIYAREESQQSILFSPLEGIKWVEKCTQEHPEILWLADINVRKTEEGQATLKGTYSEQLFGQKYIEFDRTIMTLHCLKLILDGSEKAYLTFTAAQPKEVKLSFESFKALHHQGQKLLQSQWGGMSAQQIAQTMEAALVLGDIGKSEKAREKFKPFGTSAPDHDDFYGEAMQILKDHPELCPSFARLPSSAKELLIKISNLAHYGHVTHLEGGPEMFSKLKQSRIPFTDPIALAMDLFVHTCDVAGALGHVNNQSSLVYHELTHKAMQAMASAVKVLSDPDKTELDAYNAYLEARSAWLGLDPKNRLDRVLTRFGAMLRLFTPEEGLLLKEAMIGFHETFINRFALQFDVQSSTPIIRTPTYMPALLVNLSNNPELASSKEQRLQIATARGLLFLTRVLEKHKELIANGQIDPNIPLNFNEVAGIVKASPHALSCDFTIDKEGNVHLTR